MEDKISTLDNFESVLIDEELEAILKNIGKYQFPVAHLIIVDGNNRNFQMQFNRVASPLVPDYIKWFVSTNYVIGLPAHKDGTDVFKSWPTTRRSNNKTTTVPSALVREKKIKPGNYKIYKYKNGFAFKRYELLEG